MGSFRYFFDSFYQSYRMVMIAITFYDTSVFMIFMDHSLMNRGGSCMSLQSRGGKVQMQLKKKIRGLTIIAIVAMLMSLLVACAGNSSKGSSDNAQTGSNVSSNNQSSQAGGNKEQVTLRFSWWGSDVRHQATLDAIAAYMELNPHVKIEGEYQGYDGYQQKIMTQIAGNSAPDIMQLDYPWLPDLAAQGDNFVDLSQESAVDLSQFPQTVLEEYNSVNGKIVALPMGTNGYGTDADANDGRFVSAVIPSEGESVSFVFDITASGSYDVYARHKMHRQRGIVQLLINGEEVKIIGLIARFRFWQHVIS
jgi:hypothetical protein